MTRDNTNPVISLPKLLSLYDWPGETSTQFYSEGTVTQETPMPPGFGIIQLEDKRFYPLLVQRWDEPELIKLDLIPRSHDLQVDGEEEFFSYRTRIEALRCCYRLMEEELCKDTALWDELALACCVYPERCAWYLAIIEDITGAPVDVRATFDHVLAQSSAYVCSFKFFCPSVQVRAPTIDEVLEELANRIYADTCGCCRGKASAGWEGVPKELES